MQGLTLPRDRRPGHASGRRHPVSRDAVAGRIAEHTRDGGPGLAVTAGSEPEAALGHEGVGQRALGEQRIVVALQPFEAERHLHVAEGEDGVGQSLPGDEGVVDWQHRVVEVVLESDDPVPADRQGRLDPGAAHRDVVRERTWKPRTAEPNGAGIDVQPAADLELRLLLGEGETQALLVVAQALAVGTDRTLDGVIGVARLHRRGRQQGTGQEAEDTDRSSLGHRDN